MENHALLACKLWTSYGWPVHYDGDAGKLNLRSVRNFLMQANGAEMMRLACIMATEAGIEVCLPIHDALLILAPLERLDAVIADTQEIMQEASRLVLPGFPLRSDAAVVRYPERYQDEHGVKMWNQVMRLLYGESGG